MKAVLFTNLMPIYQFKKLHMHWLYIVPPHSSQRVQFTEV